VEPVSETEHDHHGESISQAFGWLKAARMQTRTEISGGSAVLERDKPIHGQRKPLERRLRHGVPGRWENAGGEVA